MILGKEIGGPDGLEATFCASRTAMSHDDEAVGNYGRSEGKKGNLGRGTAEEMWGRAQDCS